MTTKFEQLVKVFESMSLPNIIYLDEGKDMILDGDIVYRVDIFTDHFRELVSRFEKGS